MGKILKFRRRGPLPEVEAELAYLSEELTLTANFADAMIRDGNYRAAVAVIDEQRGRLATAEQHVVRAFALPYTRRRRTHAALAGLAAVLVIGSASFAALGLHSHQATPKAPKVIEQAEHSITTATSIGSTDTVNQAKASLDALGAAALSPSNPDFQKEVQHWLDGQLNILKTQPTRNQHTAQVLMAKIEEVKKKIEDSKPAQPDTKSQPQPQPQPNTQAPAPPAAK